GVLTPTEKETKQSYTRGRRGLEHEFGKTMRFKAIRELIEGETGPLIRDLKPVWLMSPLSVSDTLPLDPGFVDVVIFDEASQIPLEEAIPTLFRGRQVIVVGDEKQLPPTDFFSSRSPDEADETFSETAPESDGSAEPEPATIDLADDSFLRFAARNLPSTMLEWHYRSRSESLIAFSNQAFYNGRLLTVPDPLPLSGGSTPADRLATGSQGVELLLSRPVSFHFLQQGVYEKRRNRQEAETIARLVAGLLERSPELTIGVIAFSEAQQSEIDSALERLAQADPEFRRRLEAEREREIDGQFVGLLVKNLENIQGDERDVVIVSICYGPNPLGKMYMNFGPINRDGGERRLNVAFSRAKQHMAVVSSIHADAVTNDYNPGALCLKNYLAYAEAVSRGDVAASNRVLTSLTRARHETADHAEDSPDNAVASDLCRELVTRGFIVDRGVGVSRFRVDMAIRRPEDRSYRLGILVDTVEQYATTDPLEREFIRPKLLQSFGWNVTSVLACDWFDRREVELQRILELLRQVPNAKVSAANSDAEVAKSADDATPESSLETADEEQEISLPPALEDSAD
ncbi:MAG: AAA domain-containing protein, partial [Planctomycetota bacterium]|nr:AAA domain-containing protein [Planctomycetota bacterium]